MKNLISLFILISFIDFGNQ